MGKRIVPIKNLLTHPLFSLGLALRILMIIFIIPQAADIWYVPFLESSVSTFNLDPWTHWSNADGVIQAFPYGYAMWIVFIPFFILSKILVFPAYYAYAATLLCGDFLLLLIIKKLIPNRVKLLLAIYWLSPIILVSTYVLGYNDLIPVLFLTLSIYYTKKLNLFWAGIFCVLAISAKFSMVLALPFFAIYFYNSQPIWQFAKIFFYGLICCAIPLIFPFLLSSSAIQMLLSNQEMPKVYQFNLQIGPTISLYLLPLAYMLIIYGAWRVRRMNFRLFQSIMGISFLAVVLLTPASPGWFIWALPLLVEYQSKSGRMAIIITGIFSTLYVVNSLLLNPYILPTYFHDQLIGSKNNFQLGPHFISLLHTGMVVIGIILMVRIWRESISLNDYFRLTRKPFVIGIAGDSGSGKDTLSDALTGLFGHHSVAKLSGDDYHLWDRKKPTWQVITHLNPMANDLEGFANDLISLIDGKSILNRHYNHATGIKSGLKSQKSNDFIIASGLHVLYLPILRSSLNLSIFLDIDEDLRRFLKIRRDVHERGHTLEKIEANFIKREPDSARYIRPQAGFADLVLSLKPIQSLPIEHPSNIIPPLKLFVRSRNGLNELSLTRHLIGVCGLQVDTEILNNANEIALTIEGEISKHDVGMAAKIICPRVFDFLDVEPKWQDGVLGLMQLIVLSHIDQVLIKRFL